MKVYVENGVLYISSDRERTVDVYRPDGTRKARLNVKRGLNSYGTLGKGLYIVGGRKLVTD